MQPSNDSLVRRLTPRPALLISLPRRSCESSEKATLCFRVLLLLTFEVSGDAMSPLGRGPAATMGDWGGVGRDPVGIMSVWSLKEWVVASLARCRRWNDDDMEDFSVERLGETGDAGVESE
jgi:hypothetical protein